MTLEPEIVDQNDHLHPATGSDDRDVTNALFGRADLFRWEQAGAVEQLVECAQHEEHTIRSLALGCLDHIDAIKIEHLMHALADEHRDVRVRAIELAIGFADIDLSSHLFDADDLVVESAAWALGEREAATQEILDSLSKVAVEHEVSICREAAIAALGAIGDEAGLPAILHGMTDKATVRRRAVLALSPFDSLEAHAALTAALDDRDRQVRQAAEDLI